MDRLTGTQVPNLTELTDPTVLAQAVREVSSRQAIHELSAVYSMAVDDQDIETVVDCFAVDGSFDRAGTSTRGHEALRTFYTSMMDRYSSTLHIAEGHTITFDDLDHASGIVTGHGELVLNGTLMMAAYRYKDTYRCVDGRWKFASRHLAFMYVMPFEQMPTGFTGRNRIRWPEQPYAEADIPEGLPVWGSHRR